MKTKLERIVDERVKRSGVQDVDQTEICWALKKDGTPCCRKTVTGCPVPYCCQHLKSGDGAFRVVPRPIIGKVLVARHDLPKGYKMVYWGQRKTWKACRGIRRDYALSFRSGGGVIDPVDETGATLKYMSCPGPTERTNVQITSHCFGTTRHQGEVGRMIELKEAVPKGHQLVAWYGHSWFEARGIQRQDVGCSRYPAPKRRAASIGGSESSGSPKSASSGRSSRSPSRDD